MIFKIWVAADCLPKVVNSIGRSIDKLLSTYWQYRSGRGRTSGRKERKSELQVAQPSRRSRRLNRDAPEDSDDTLTVVSTKAKVTNQVKKLSRNRCVNPFKEEWLEDVGTKLFDIISLDRKKLYEKAINDGRSPAEYFDYEVYIDQMNQRSEYIETSKITREFKVAEERQNSNIQML